jgi:alkylation response protein AidB-like acyl-CoA dehydrogenase
VPAEALAEATLPAATRTRVARRAAAVDAGTADPRATLSELAADGLLTLGAPGHAGTVGEQAAVLAAVAEECLATAFCGWAHRMVVEYLAGAGGEAAAEIAGLRRIGSTAMAGGFKACLGIAPLSVTGRRDGAGVVLDGRVAWASNLHDDALILLAADVGGEPRVVAVDRTAPGLRVRPVGGLLALDATASGSLVLDGVRVSAGAILDEDLPRFAARVRPAFLVLQAAFCLGLARAAIDAAAAGMQGLGLEFADDVAALGLRRADAEARLAALAGGDTPIADHVRLRLDVAVLARDAVRTEAAVAGGRGYVAASATGRRLREAAFIPVQSPTEGQLRWELRHSS